jgi:hypothetical protein
LALPYTPLLVKDVLFALLCFVNNGCYLKCNVENLPMRSLVGWIAPYTFEGEGRNDGKLLAFVIISGLLGW